LIRLSHVVSDFVTKLFENHIELHFFFDGYAKKHKA